MFIAQRAHRAATLLWTPPDPNNRADTTMPDRDTMEPRPAESERARSHTLGETDGKERIIDPNIDYDKYPNYEVSKIDYPSNEPDDDTPQGDMSDIYRPEGEFGLARPWLRPDYDVDAEEADHSEEMAAWERQKEETGESTYIPPGKTIDDLKWGRPLHKDVKRK
ncbi:hypothetical protein MMC16_006047 [Acarospora aff. strigata]|nr:hypothetical protein [Acarospora aff. strigata]